MEKSCSSCSSTTLLTPAQALHCPQQRSTDGTTHLSGLATAHVLGSIVSTGYHPYRPRHTAAQLMKGMPLPQLICHTAHLLGEPPPATNGNCGWEIPFTGMKAVDNGLAPDHMASTRRSARGHHSALRHYTRDYEDTVVCPDMEA